jgi:N-methylhydantoinase B/oxoprolinase/acetone carboxylase alpha subunit
LDTPIEAFERTYPMKVLRYRIRRGSGGRGRFDGGDGIEKVIQVLEPTTLSLITERRVSRPWGLVGGSAGAAGENWLWPAGDESRRMPLPDKVTVRLSAGDALQLLTPGGGGWGTDGGR